MKKYDAAMTPEPKTKAVATRLYTGPDEYGNYDLTPALDRVVARLQDTEPGMLLAENWLSLLTEHGVKGGEAEASLEKFDAVHAADYPNDEDYREARSEAWQDFLVELGSLDATNATSPWLVNMGGGAKGEVVTPAEKPAPPALSLSDHAQRVDEKISVVMSKQGRKKNTMYSYHYDNGQIILLTPEGTPFALLQTLPEECAFWSGLFRANSSVSEYIRRNYVNEIEGDNEKDTHTRGKNRRMNTLTMAYYAHRYITGMCIESVGKTTEEFWQEELTDVESLIKGLEPIVPEEKETIPVTMAGCWLDSHRGVYIVPEIVRIAQEYGYELSAEDEKIVAAEEVSFGSCEDNPEAITWISESAEFFLNDLCPNGYWIGYNEGDFGMYPLDDEVE